MKRRGSAGQCSFLVGLKEMTLLSGFDQCGPCSYVASVNGKIRVRQGETDSQSLPSGDRAGGTLETVVNGFKLGVFLAPVWKRVFLKGTNRRFLLGFSAWNPDAFQYLGRPLSPHKYGIPLN